GRGMALEALKRYEEALECYREAVKYADEDTWATLLYNQGNVLVLLRRYKDALPLLERATQLNPNHSRRWARLGSELRNLNREDDALKAYRQASRLDPAYACAWNEQGLTLQSIGRYEEALQAYRRASAAAPRDWLHLYQQADVLVYLEDYLTALDVIEQG